MRKISGAASEAISGELLRLNPIHDYFKKGKNFDVEKDATIM